MHQIDTLHQALLQSSPGPLLLLDGTGSLLDSTASARALFQTALAGSEASAIQRWLLDQEPLQALLHAARDASDWIAVPAPDSPRAPFPCEVRAIAWGQDYLYLLRIAERTRPHEVNRLLQNQQIQESAPQGHEKPCRDKPSQDKQNHDKLRRVALELADEIEHRLHVERKLATILNAIGQGIVQVDEQGRIVMANQVLLDLLGYQTEELIGQPIERLIPEAEQAQHADARGQYQQAPVTRPMGSGRPLYARQRSGHQIPVEIGLNHVNLDGKPQILATLLDITERQRSEQELLRKTRELERANAEANDLAYITAHDLTDPLRGISNYAGFLLEDYEGQLDAAGQDMLNSMGRLTRRMEQLITQLLHFSRLGQKELRFESLDLNALVPEIIESLRPQLDAANAHCTLANPLPTVCGDREQVMEAIRHLSGNAIKFNDKPTKSIEIGSDNGQ